MYIMIILIENNEEKISLKINNKNDKKEQKYIILKEPSFFEIFYYEIINNKTRMNLISLIINLLSFYLYYLSLEGCIGTQIDCLKIMTLDKFFDIFYLVLFSSFLSSFTLIFSFFNKISIFCMIYPFISYILFYFYDNGSDLAHHGLYNNIFNIHSYFYNYNLF